MRRGAAVNGRRPPGRAERVLAWVDGWPERTGYAVGAAFGAAAGAALLWEPVTWKLGVFGAIAAAAVPLAYLARVRQRVEAPPEPGAPVTEALRTEAPVTEAPPKEVVVPWPGEPLAPLHPETPPPIRDEEQPPGGRETEPPSAPIMAPLPENLLEPHVAMVQVPGGEFWMGSAEDDPRASPSEKPRHRVRVEDFELGKLVITQTQFAAVMGYNPSDFKGRSLPVTNLSWLEAIDFCNALSDRHGLEHAYARDGDRPKWIRSANGYRLPTEAEWEYAARAGTDTSWSFGDDAALLREHAWYSGNSAPFDRKKPDPWPVGHHDMHGEVWAHGDSVSRLRPVGQKKPNPWGLFDMHGNVWEWCWDSYGAYLQPPAPGSPRVLRGGSCIDGPALVRSGSRFWYGGRAWVIGLRVARGPVHAS